MNANKQITRRSSTWLHANKSVVNEMKGKEMGSKGKWGFWVWSSHDNVVTKDSVTSLRFVHLGAIIIVKSHTLNLFAKKLE